MDFLSAPYYLFVQLFHKFDSEFLSEEYLGMEFAVLEYRLRAPVFCAVKTCGRKREKTVSRDHLQKVASVIAMDIGTLSGPQKPGWQKPCWHFLRGATLALAPTYLCSRWT